MKEWLPINQEITGTIPYLDYFSYKPKQLCSVPLVTQEAGSSVIQ